MTAALDPETLQHIADGEPVKKLCSRCAGAWAICVDGVKQTHAAMHRIHDKNAKAAAGIAVIALDEAAYRIFCKCRDELHREQDAEAAMRHESRRPHARD
jgi:hypothetical protein